MAHIHMHTHKLNKQLRFYLMLICLKIGKDIYLAFGMLFNVKIVTLLGKECNVNK